MIYRLIAGENNLSLPYLTAAPTGSSGRITGFWSRSRECVLNMIAAHKESAFQMDGGGLWEDDFYVLIADENDCQIVDGTPFKTSHRDEFDRDEIFVTHVAQYTRVTWKQYEKE